MPGFGIVSTVDFSRSWEGQKLGDVEGFVEIVTITVVRHRQTSRLEADIGDRLYHGVGEGIDDGDGVRAGICAIQLSSVRCQHQAVWFGAHLDRSDTYLDRL